MRSGDLDCNIQAAEQTFTKNTDPVITICTTNPCEFVEKSLKPTPMLNQSTGSTVMVEVLNSPLENTPAEPRYPRRARQKPNCLIDNQ